MSKIYYVSQRHGKRIHVADLRLMDLATLTDLKDDIECEIDELKIAEKLKAEFNEPVTASHRRKQLVLEAFLLRVDKQHKKLEKLDIDYEGVGIKLRIPTVELK